MIGGELGSTIQNVTWIFGSPYVPSTSLPVAFFGQSYSNTIPASGASALIPSRWMARRTPLASLASA